MVIFALTGTVVTGNVAEIAPAGMMTLAGIEATDGAELFKLITKPPTGALPVSFTVPTVLIPPISDVDLSEIDDSAAG